VGRAAKGRTNGFDRHALQRAKDQACQVIEISGDPPILHIGLQVHFGEGVMHLEVDDPKPNQKSRLRLPISKEKFAAGYYRPFKEWLSEGELKSFNNRIYRQRNISELDMNVGIVDTILEFPESTVLNMQESDEEGNTFAAEDGLLVSLGQLWSTENMMLEPQERQ
jgi:hypothetical protein